MIIGGESDHFMRECAKRSWISEKQKLLSAEEKE